MSSLDQDHYNYPTATRKDLMLLSTINSADEKTRKFKGGLLTRRDYSYNLFNVDIQGSSPKRFGVLNNKVDYINKNDDIERSNSKLLHIKLNKPDYNLTNADIRLSSPQSTEFHTMRIGQNPLEPKYNLPKVDKLPCPEPKFIRDNINIDDIEGTKPKKYMVWKTREKIDCSDIEGTKKKKTKYRQTYYSNINYEDVTHNKFKTRRHLDPNDPVYEINYNNGEKYIYGQIEKSKPQTIYPFKYSDPFNMKITDIDGSQYGSKNKINKYNSIYSGLLINDVPGAQTSTLKKGIVTLRKTDPLAPNYIIPGSKEISLSENNPYGKTSDNFKIRTLSSIPFQGHLPSLTREEIKNVGDSMFVQNNTNENKNIRENIENVDQNVNDKMYFKTEGNLDRENDQFMCNKPDPFYGFAHDKYLVPKDKDSKSSLKNTAKGTTSKGKKEWVSNTKTNKIMSSTNSNFKSTFAQKLDTFINSS